MHITSDWDGALHITSDWDGALQITSEWDGALHITKVVLEDAALQVQGAMWKPCGLGSLLRKCRGAASRLGATRSVNVLPSVSHPPLPQGRTAAAGATSTTQLVNLLDFYSAQVLPELQVGPWVVWRGRGATECHVALRRR